MTKNVLEVGPQIFAVIAGILVFLAGAFAFSFRYRTGAEAGRRGPREAADAAEQPVSPSGFIDSFAGRIEEAGGGLPYTGWIIMGVIVVCYFAYLFLFWKPRWGIQMPYVYEVSFDLDPRRIEELQVGRDLQRTIGYLKVRLPGRSGFILSEAVYSVDDPKVTRVVFRSEWSDWEDVERHRASSLVEDKVLEEFEPHVSADSLTTRIYARVGSGPLRGY